MIEEDLGVPGNENPSPNTHGTTTPLLLDAHNSRRTPMPRQLARQEFRRTFSPNTRRNMRDGHSASEADDDSSAEDNRRRALQECDDAYHKF